MKLGELFISLGVQGDTKKLKEAAKDMQDAERKITRLLAKRKALEKATSDEEKALIEEKFALQDEIEETQKLITAKEEQERQTKSSILTTAKLVGGIKLALIAFDRLGNSLIKNNQAYMTFNQQTGLSINRLNRMSTLAQLSGAGMSPEQVMGDLQGIQQKIFELGMTGQGSQTFAMLGMNPMGMKPDQFILALRQRLKGLNGEQKSFFLNQLGLSQEWLNVINLSDEKFRDYLKTSKELQLSDKERAKLAAYTELQQKNNMRWELAKQRILITILPMIQQIMEFSSKIALNFANWFEKNPKWLNVFRDVLLLMTGSSIIKTINAFRALLGGGIIGSLLGGGAKATTKASGGLFAGLMNSKWVKKGLAGFLGKQALKKGALAGIGAAGVASGGVIPLILGIVGILWTIYDVVRAFFHKEEEKDEQEDLTDTVDTGGRYVYHNVNANMTNNFNNVDRPTETAMNEFRLAYERLTAATSK